MRPSSWLVLLAACGDNVSAHVELAATHSSSIVLAPDDTRLYVVNADADSISVIDPAARMLVDEIALAPPPAVDTAGNFAPAVMPRAIALDGTTLYATGMRSNSIYAIDLPTGPVRSAPACSEPVGVVASAGAIYVACLQDDVVIRFDRDLHEVARAAVPAQPWALALWPADGSLVVTGFGGAGVTALDPDTLAVRATYAIPDVAPRGDARLAHGAVRGLYDAVPRGDELWVPHVMLGTDTAQPDLDFERTVFPALSVIHAGGALHATLSIDAADVPGIDGAIADIVSGPHAVAFTSDGSRALVVDTNSEDILVMDADRELQADLLRPLPGHMPEGLAIAADDATVYVDERNTGDVAVLHLGDTLTVDGAPIARLAADPMPASQRLGQHLFYSANSDEYAITQNHWVACASCHLEGRSDAVTWRFEQGPRDTPTNAGGTIGTGFLFRTADRTKVQDYFRTIAVEQGGSLDPVRDAALLDALADYVDHAIPFPQPPTTDPALVARGQAIFEDPVVGCSTCHSGPQFTDSGAGNPSLDLAGPVLLHDVGTCVTTGDFPDVAHTDVDGDARAACKFDTPSLRGIAASPPYLHDGSAKTLRDVLEVTRGKMGDISGLSEDDLGALVEYVRSL